MLGIVRRSIVLLVIGGVGMMASCGRDLQPSSIEEGPDGSFTLYLSCAHDVSARVIETDTEIRVDRIGGDPYPEGDCLGGVELDLAAPIGDRQVFVNGDAWVRVDDNCELAVYSYPDVGERWSWAVPLRCRDDR